MLFGFLSSRKAIALEFTETHLRVARGEQHGTTVNLRSHAEAAYPAELKGEGDAQVLRNLILSVLKSAGETSARDVTILLAPSLVYTCLTRSVASEMHPSTMHEEIAKVLPQDLSELVLRTRILGRVNGETFIGAAAVRKSTMTNIQDAFVGTKLRIGCVTTLPCVLASRIGHAENSDLIGVSAVGSSTPTVTLFHRGFPIDESVLPGATDVKLAKELEALLKEYARCDIFHGGIVAVDGSEDLLRACESVVGKNSPAASWSVIPAFPGASAAELPWLGLAAASTVRCENIAVNFAST